MSSIVRRVLLLVVFLALLGALWRLTTMAGITQGQLLINSVEMIVLIVIGLLCLWNELRLARRRKN